MPGDCIKPWEELTIQDAFVQEIETTIQTLKTLESERVSYMTLEMKMKEERKEGRKEGLKEGRKEGRLENLLENIKSMMLKLNLTADEAMEVLSVSPELRQKITPML